MFRYEYECDTCSENHFAEVKTEAEASEFLSIWAEAGLKVWRVTK